MNRISTAVLAATLASGTVAVIPAPAFAKKKEEPAPKGPAYTQAVAIAAQKAKTALLAKDMTTADAAITEAEAAVKTDDDKYLAGFLRYAYVSQKIADASTGTTGSFDPGPMIAPLDALIANPKTPPDMLTKFLYSRATIAYDQKQYPLAVQYFTRAQAAGSVEPNLPLYLARSKVNAGDTAGGMADLAKLIDSGKPQSEDIYKFALGQSVKAGLRSQSVDWLKRWMIAFPTTKTWRDGLGYYGLSNPPIAKLDKRQTIDLFRLMRAAKALPDQAYYEEYAQSVMDVGLPDETKAVIAEGKALGKIPGAGNSPIQALAASAATQAKGNYPADEAKANAASTGAPSSQAGDAYFGAGNYAKAITLYRQAITKGVTDADAVNLHLGMALGLSGDKVGAKAAFALVTTAPRSELAQLWTVWLDNPPTG